MLYPLALLVLSALAADPPEIVIVAVPGGVEARFGEYVVTGKRIVLDQKNQLVVVDGDADTPANVSRPAAQATQSGKKIVLDLTKGSYRVIDR